MRLTERTRIAACAGALALSISPLVHAGPTAEDSKRADALFEEGTKWMDQGDYARACPALQQSLAIDPAAGTALALARCHEKAGRIATAWTAYRDAEARARATNQTARADAARDQAAALAPRLPRVVVTAGAQVASLPGLVVEIDGLAIAPTSLGTQIPVDPGEHRVEARATGKAVAKRVVRVAEGESQSIAFSSLDDAALSSEPTSTSTPPAVAGDEGGLGPMTIAGIVVGGVGVAGLAFGGVLGLLAADASSDSNETCAPFERGAGGTSDEYARCVDDREGAGSLADGSTIAFIVGGVLVAGGIGLVLLDGASSDEAALVVVPGPGSMMARGKF
jgi:hypothetical protein